MLFWLKSAIYVYILFYKWSFPAENVLKLIILLIFHLLQPSNYFFRKYEKNILCQPTQFWQRIT